MDAGARTNGALSASRGRTDTLRQVLAVPRRGLLHEVALIRWDHPTHGRIAPSVFVPLAEETGLIDEIGAWVLRTACTEVTRWAGLSPGRVPRVSINLSAHQLADPQLAWAVQAAMAHAGATPSWVTLELTESMLTQNSSAYLERLHALRALGVQIAIDDFGTGYSSLAYLERFPVTHIKIDRSFVTPLDDPGRGAGVVRAIIEIGRALGLATVAEGIETPTQLQRLRELGCGLGQGYLFAQPIERDAMAELVARKGGPAFVREIATADRNGTVRTKASTSGRGVAPAPAAPAESETVAALGAGAGAELGAVGVASGAVGLVGARPSTEVGR